MKQYRVILTIYIERHESVLYYTTNLSSICDYELQQALATVRAVLIEY
jgi:hypothetical protein